MAEKPKERDNISTSEIINFLEMAESGDGARACLVNENFCASHPVEMVVEHKGGLFSKTLFKINNSKKRDLIFHVEGSSTGLYHTRILLDAAGFSILTMRTKVLSWQPRWKVYKGASTKEGDLLFSLKMSKYWQIATNLDVFLPSNTSEIKCDYHLDCENSNKWCTIYQGDSIVAEVMESPTFGESLTEKVILVVKVHPQVDRAFISSLVVILSEIKLAQTSSIVSAIAAGATNI